MAGDADINRAKAEVANSLGGTASDETDGLRWRIRGVLYSPPCKAINFVVDDVWIVGFKYAYVAELLDRGKIKIKIDAAIAAKDEGGEYNPNSNTLILPWSDGLDGPDADNRRMTVVHECTHAALDASRQGLSTSFLTNEATAYLASVVYLINAGRSYPKDNNDFTKSVYAIAEKIVAEQRLGKMAKADPTGVAYIKKMLGVVYSRARGRTIDESTREVYDGINYY